MSVIDKISPDLIRKVETGQFAEIQDKIKLRPVICRKDEDTRQALMNVQARLIAMGVKSTLISYGGRIKYLKVSVKSFEELLKIAAFSEIDSVDFFAKAVLS